MPCINMVWADGAMRTDSENVFAICAAFFSKSVFAVIRPRRKRLLIATEFPEGTAPS